MDVVVAMAGALAIALTAPNSDPLNITTGTDVHPMFDGGKLIGCEADFAAIRLTTSHDRGGPVALNGALAVIAWPGKEAMLGLKLGAITSDGKRVRPTSAGLTDENKTNIADLYQTTDITPGYISAIYHMKKGTIAPLALMEADDILTAYFTLPGETLSSDFYFDLRVKHFDPQNPADSSITAGAGKAFAECLSQLLNKG